jgi:glutathione S-transferase
MGQILPAGNARVPCLHDGGFQVRESIAIAEYLAERHPEMWTADAQARARARCISAEMHAGSVALRTAMPMNLKLRLRGRPAAPDLQREIDRVVEIWREAREQFATGVGPWLFGDLPWTFQRVAGQLQEIPENPASDLRLPHQIYSL